MNLLLLVMFDSEYSDVVRKNALENAVLVLAVSVTSSSVRLK